MEFTAAELDAIYDTMVDQADRNRHYPEDEHEAFSSAYSKIHDEMVKRKLLYKQRPGRKAGVFCVCPLTP